MVRIQGKLLSTQQSEPLVLKLLIPSFSWVLVSLGFKTSGADLSPLPRHLIGQLCVLQFPGQGFAGTRPSLYSWVSQPCNY